MKTLAFTPGRWIIGGFAGLALVGVFTYAVARLDDSRMEELIIKEKPSHETLKLMEGNMFPIIETDRGPFAVNNSTGVKTPPGGYITHPTNAVEALTVGQTYCARTHKLTHAHRYAPAPSKSYGAHPPTKRTLGLVAPKPQGMACKDFKFK